MDAIRYHETGDPDVLTLEEVDRPTPAKGEVLVDVRAASVNPVDELYRTGVYTPSELPMIPGSDFAGVVAETGDDVDEFAVGDGVVGDGLNKNTGYQGSFAEYTVAPVERIAALPPDVGFERAAAVGHVGLTAWHALFDFGGLQLDDTCLIHGGSGGVGHVAVQLADAAGANVIATAGSERKRERVRELGGDLVLDYRRDDLAAAVSAAGAPDVVLDHMLDEYVELDIEVAAPEGRIVAIEGGTVEFSNTAAARGKNLGLFQIAASAPRNFATILASLVDLIQRDRLTVDVAEAFPLAEAATAHRFLEERSYVGKVVVTI